MEPKQEQHKESEIDPVVSGQTQSLITQYRNRKKKKNIATQLKKKVDFSNRIIVASRKVIERKHIEYSKTGGEGNNTRKQKKMTKPELQCLDILTELKFLVSREFKMLGKYYDFKIYGHQNKEINEIIKDAKILVECDGDYWHFSQGAESIRAVKQKIEDKYKNSLCLVKGYNLIRIWESEMFRDVLKSKVLEVLYQVSPTVAWNEYIV